VSIDTVAISDEHPTEIVVVSEPVWYANALTIAHELAIHSYQSERVSKSLKGLLPFESRFLEGQLYFGLPENAEEWAKSSYLYTLAIIAMERKGAIVEKIASSPCGLKLTPDQETILHGFGLPFVNEAIPKYEKGWKSTFKSGVLCAMKYIIHEKNLDRRWFNFVDSRPIAETLFGEVWAIKYKDEKRVLDFIISLFNSIKLINVPSYLIPITELKKKLGLSAKRHKNKVFSEQEYDWIEEDYTVILATIRNFNYLAYADFDALKVHMSDITLLCKSQKNYVALCTRIKDERLALLFKDKKAKKRVPIEKLIANHVGTVDYINIFSPCVACGLRSAYKVSMIPQTNEERIKVDKSLSEWLVSQKKVGNTNARLPSIETWYRKELGI